MLDMTEEHYVMTKKGEVKFLLRNLLYGNPKVFRNNVVASGSALRKAKKSMER